jgi:hypothetical protein
VTSPEPVQTGHPAVDQAVAAVVNAADVSPAEQVAPLAEADRVLRETLDSIGDV